MGNMHKLDERGSLLIPLVLVSTLLLLATGFGAWAFAGRQDYKDNVDAKIVEAVEAAGETLSIEKEAEFAEREKSPNKSYQGPAAYGSLNIMYPKTWGAYIIDTGKSREPINGYLHPNFVPDVGGDSSFALRFQVLNQNYDSVLAGYNGSVKSGAITVAAYRPPKVEAALGSRLVGDIEPKKPGTMVLLPLRDKTIRIWTEGQDFKGDFEAVLNALTFNL